MEGSSKPSKFLFVNKTVSSDLLTRSKTDEKQQILSHVQQRRRKREEGKLKPPPWASFTSALSLEDDEDLNEADTVPTAGLDTSGLAAAEQSSSTQLLQFYPTHNGWDPFYCTVAGIDASIQPMLHYVFSRFAKSTFLSEAFAPSSVSRRRVQMRHTETMVERLKRCVDDEMLMYSTLAYGSSSMAWSLGKIEEGKAPEYFIDRALQLVRARLSTPAPTIDTWLLLSVYSLAITEMWNGIPEMWAKCPPRRAGAVKSAKQCRRASRIHLRALVSLVNGAGGWDNVNPYVLESMILCDKFLAILEMTRPILPLKWDPGPLPSPSPKQLQSNLRRLAEGFTRLDLRPDLAELIQEIADYVRAAQFNWEYSNVTLKEESWMYLGIQALNYRLLLMDDLEGIENCIRLATLLFLQNVIHFEAVQISAIVVLQHFKAAATEAEIWRQNDHSGLRLWCLCTGGMTPELTNEREWFVQTIATFAQPSLVDLRKPEFQRLIESYLFVAAKQDDQLHKLIEDICSRRDAMSSFTST
jgi:hypothetical protein